MRYALRSTILTALGCVMSVSAHAPAAAQLTTRNQDYLRDIVDLSDTLGKAHAMRVVCNGSADQYWRRYMVSLLELEAPVSYTHLTLPTTSRV